jgi:hypothetical protein
MPEAELLLGFSEGQRAEASVSGSGSLHMEAGLQVSLAMLRDLTQAGQAS